MSDTGVIVTLSPRDYDAVLFDLAGVLTPLLRATGVRVPEHARRVSWLPENRGRPAHEDGV